MPDWEKVSPNCERLTVPGGWVYRTWHTDPDNGYQGHAAAVYVPDPQRWRDILAQALLRRQK